MVASVQMAIGSHMLSHIHWLAQFTLQHDFDQFALRCNVGNHRRFLGTVHLLFAQSRAQKNDRRPRCR
jgi:hypothetical protein